MDNRKKTILVIFPLTAICCSISFMFANKKNVVIAENNTTYESISANVASIKTFKQDSGYAFSFFLSDSDYDSKSMIAANKNTWIYGNDLNFLDKISFEFKSGSTFTNERFLNVWNQNGAFTLRTTSESASAHDFTTDIDSITVAGGCTFPSYDYLAGTLSTPTYYKTSKTMIFENDGTGNFTYNQHYGDVTPPEGYTCIETEISAVNEKNGTEQLSFLQFVLSASDYGSSFIDLGKTYATKLSELKFLDNIYINGQKASLDARNKYTLQSVLNYGGSSAYAIRTQGNNTGSYYKSGNKYISTNEDCAAYEVVIAKGCCFPSYSYLTGSTLTPTCYINTKTVRFIWDKGQYVLSDNFTEPNRIDNNVVKVASHGSGNDTAIDFYMDAFDYPNTVGDCILDKTFNSSCKITLTNTNDEIITLGNERFANVWNKTGCFSVRKPNTVSWSDIKIVTVYQGCEFPTYYSYTNFDNSRYVTTETRRFYGNGDGTFYLCNEKSADQFASEFLSATGTICSETEISQRESQLNDVYTAFSDVYTNMAPEEKAKLVDTGSETVRNMLERYDYIVNKYDIKDDFLNRKQNMSFSLMKNNSSFIPLIISISLITVFVSSFVIVYKFKKRKEGK